MKLKELPWRIKRKILKTLIEHSHNPQPSSAPLLSGDSFRAISKVIFENTEEKEIERLTQKIDRGDIVFVRSDIIEWFFKNVHNKITSSYVLITHNSDKIITENETQYLDNKILHWFAQNAQVRHPKITPLPIGLENKKLMWAGIPSLVKKTAQDSVHPKKDLIFYSFNDQTNYAERENARKILEKYSLAEKGFWEIPPRYFPKMSSYKFIASPPGNGTDCHRTWEALYTKVIPIVKRSSSMEYFASLGLPLWIIDDWEEILQNDQYDLSKKYDLMMAQSNFDSLDFNWWLKVIKKYSNHEKNLDNNTLL